ncbi:MAG TPA: benzoate/H(+) symporter BenE family transporter [Microbacteriaceae bacterium]|nr:benzoate/H(+) symporter BenE family transporter [Microbacteriaceae bacterium]
MTEGVTVRPSSSRAVMQPAITGIIAVMTGFSSSFTLVLAALVAVGATHRQAASGLLAVCVMAGLASIIVPLRLRRPVSFSWSTPGAAALLAAGAPGGGFPVAVGAFIVAGALTFIAGAWPAFERAILAIPRPIASAMLAGVLLPICMEPARAAIRYPWVVVPMLLVWLVMLRLAPRWAVPAAMLVAVIGIVTMAGPAVFAGADLAPTLEWVAPEFDLAATLTLAVPLFIVTMAGQHIPGFAVLSTFGYSPTVRPALMVSGVGSVLGAFAGGHAVNLAALSAALMAGPEAGEDRDRRWIASAVNGVGYLVFGATTGVIAVLVAAAPPQLITAAAGLGMLGALVVALKAALEETALGLPAVVTLVVTVSGVGVFGVGSALWGLAAGIVAHVATSRLSPR